MPKIIQMVLEYLQIQSKAFASLYFSASPPRIGYLSLWMHQGLPPPWFIPPRGISFTWHEIEASDQIPHPLWVGIKCPAPGKTSFIKFPPSRAAKDVKCPGYTRGGCLSFDLTDTLHQSLVKRLRVCPWENQAEPGRRWYNSKHRFCPHMASTLGLVS